MLVPSEASYRISKRNDQSARWTEKELIKKCEDLTEKLFTILKWMDGIRNLSKSEDPKKRKCASDSCLRTLDVMWGDVEELWEERQRVDKARETFEGLGDEEQASLIKFIGSL